MEVVGVKEDGTLVLNPDSDLAKSSSIFERASSMKEKGNLLLVKMKRTFEAIRMYTAGIELITESGKKNRPEDEKLKILLMELYSNCALAFLREKDYESAIVICDQAIELCPERAFKAMHRKGQALKLLGRVGESKTWLKRAKTLKNKSA